NCTFNPLDKLIESYDENKKLYERLVQAEKDKVEFLENLLKQK
ncbi:MAG: transcriptional regulator, partial [Flavobacterium sp.]